MASSKYFDTHTSIKQAPIHLPVVDGVFGGASSSVSSMSLFGSTKQRKGNEIDAYTLYNYLAVTRIAMKGSQVRPIAGLVRETGISSQGLKPYLQSARQKEWLVQFYGGSVIQSAEQEMDVLPSGHPLCELFRRVNDEDWWESFAFELLLFLELTGEYFIWVIPNGLATKNSPLGMPAQMWIIPTHWVEIRFAKSGRISSYRITPDGDRQKKKDIDPSQIIHGMFKNPRDKHRGFSPSTAGGPWIDSGEAIEESRYHAFRNSISPSLWLKIMDKSVKPNDPIIDKIKERWMQRAVGIKKTREPQVLPPDIEVDDTGNYQPRELDFESSEPQVRDAILALRGVNKFIAGFTEDMNRAQVETAMVHFCEMVINPTLKMVAGALQERLAPRYDDRIRIWFPDCSPENRGQVLEEMKFRWTAGALTPNEILIHFGETTVNKPEYNTGYVPSKLMPLLGMKNKEEEPNDPNGEGPDEDNNEETELQEDSAFMNRMKKWKINGEDWSRSNGHGTGVEKLL